MMRSRPGPGQGGFTLIELLIAIAVMAVIVPAIAGAFFVTFRTLGTTTDRVGSSAGASLLTAAFGPDIQSSVSVSTTGDAGCAIPSGTVLFTVTRVDGTATWFSTPASGSAPATLGRKACIGATSTTSVVELDPTTPALTCLPGCAGAPTSVSLTFTPLEGRPVTLHGSRRNS